MPRFRPGSTPFGVGGRIGTSIPRVATRGYSKQHPSGMRKKNVVYQRPNGNKVNKYILVAPWYNNGIYNLKVGIYPERITPAHSCEGVEYDGSPDYSPKTQTPKGCPHE